MKMVNLGYKNFVPESEVFALVPARTNKSVKEKVDRARENEKYLSFVYGGIIRSYILLKNGYVIASNIGIDTLYKRFKEDGFNEDDEEELDEINGQGEVD